MSTELREAAVAAASGRRVAERSLRAQFVFFCLVGVGNAAVDASVYAALVGLLGWTGNVEATGASVIGFLAGAAHSFAWNSRVTFRGRSARRARSLASRFFLVAAIGALVAAATSFVVLAAWPFAFRLAAAKAAALAAAVLWNFSLSRQWVFRRPRS